jgi:ABC-type proline/glycine betaine transport system ATPase subunit
VTRAKAVVYRCRSGPLDRAWFSSFNHAAATARAVVTPAYQVSATGSYRCSIVAVSIAVGTGRAFRHMGLRGVGKHTLPSCLLVDCVHGEKPTCENA